MLTFRCVAVFLACVGFFASMNEAKAEVLSWTIKSDYEYTVQVKFYSQTRNHEWPEPGRAWDIDDSKEHTYRLECRSGEKICYSAWSKGNPEKANWGTFRNKLGCTTCCQICGSGEGATRLVE